MWCYYAAGCISGVAAFVISYPLDTIKTQQQLRSLRFSEAVQHIHNHRGWKGFYRGLMMPTVANGLLTAVFFGLCGDLRDYFVESRRHKAGWYWTLSTKIPHTPYHPHQRPFLFFRRSQEDVTIEEDDSTGATFREFFISGALAGFIVLAISTPIELIKTKLQSQMKSKMFKGPLDCFQAVYKHAGVKGLYRGIIPMTIKNVACSGVKFGFVCYILDLCEADLFPTSSWQTILALWVGGLVSWTVAIPFDTIKTRMQADDHRKPYYKGMVHATKDIYKIYGIRGMYRGYWNASMRVAPLSMLTFIVYDYLFRHWCI